MRSVRSLIGVIVITCLSGMTAAISAPVAGSFADNRVFEINPSLVHRASDGQSVTVDTTAQDRTWSYLVRTRAGVLQKGKNYRVTFRYRIATPDGFFHILCRPLGGAGDSLRANAGYATEFKTVQFKFNSGDSALPPSFQIHALEKMRGELTDFKLVETGSDRYFPVGGKNTVPWQGKLGKLPTGARDFTVALPKNTSGVTVKAADFGFSPDNPDNVPALNQALAHCKKIGAARLELSPGTYRMRFHDSLMFNEMRDFTFDGGGATLVYYGDGRATGVNLEHCERVVVRKVNFDWDWEHDPLASIVRVVRVKPDFTDFEFVDYKRFPRRDLRVAFVTSYDPKTRSFGVADGIDGRFEFSAGENRPKTEWRSDNVLRVWGQSQLFRIGQFFRMQHRYYDGSCIQMNGNRHLTLEDINIYSCSGNGLIVDGRQQYWQLRGVRVAPPKDALRRVISSTADPYHIIRSCGFCKVENCSFAFAPDDCINAHDVFGVVGKSGPMAVISRNRFSPSMVASFRPGDILELRNLNFSPTGFKAPLKAIREIDGAKGIYELQFDQPIPEPVVSGDDFVLFNRAFNTGNMIIRNCDFYDCYNHAILVQGSDFTIENNRFRKMGTGGIDIITGYFAKLWCEGYGVDNVLVRNNTFDMVNPRNNKNYGRARDIYIGIFQDEERTGYHILSNILFEGNTFINSFGVVAVISSAENVIFRNNTFKNPNPTYPVTERAGFFLTHDSQNVKIVNNRWMASPYVPSPGIYATPDSVTGLAVGGNRVLSAESGTANKEE